MHVLRVLQGPDRGAQFRLPPNEPQLIGRSSEALTITDRMVSRRHAELTPDDGRWHLRDLDSSNGTFVNGERVVERVVLAPGDQVRCGDTLMVFAAIPDDANESPIQGYGPDEMDSNIESRLGARDAPLSSQSSDPLRHAIEHLRVIYALTAIIARSPRRETLLDSAMELIFREFSPQRGFILLQPEGSTRLEPGAIRYAVRPRTRDEGRIPVSRTIVHHVITRGEGILSTNAMNDARFRSGDSVRAYGIRTAMCVPLSGSRRILGVIHIDSSTEGFEWSEAELRLLSHLAQHLGLALEGADAIEAAMRRERLAAMGETTAALSHSIKNILQGLRGGADAVELALSRGDLDHAREGWPILSRNLDRILSLTLNMLAWSKPRSLDIELVSIPNLLGEIAELFAPECERRGITLSVECDESMPPAPIDPNAVHQALTNLLSNAVDAIGERSGRVSLKATYRADERVVEVSVTDDGPGVPPAIRERIFEPFVSSKGQRGTGLGLAVTRKVAEEHGGWIGLQSEPGRGTTVTLVLPCDRPVVDSGDTHQPRGLSEGEAAALDEQF